MWTLKGYVSQIIPPKEQKDYMRRLDFPEDKYFVVIEREEFYKKGYFGKVMHRVFHRRDIDYYQEFVFAFDKVNFKVGDLVEIDSVRYRAPTDIRRPRKVRKIRHNFKK